MAKTKRPSGGKKIVDVTSPGKSAPAANSKSVILSNRPLLKDPMMINDVPAANGGAAEKLPAKAANQPELQQLTAPLLPAEEQGKTDDTAKTTEPAEAVEPTKAADLIIKTTTAPKAINTVPQTIQLDTPDGNGPEPAEKPEDPAPKPAPDTAEEPEHLSGTADSADEPRPDNSDATAGKTKPAHLSADDKAKQAEAEAAKHQAAVEKLAGSKRYFLPINAIEKRKTKRFVVLGILVAVILAIAWVDVALDAGLIHLGTIKAPTHFFSN